MEEKEKGEHRKETHTPLFSTHNITLRGKVPRGRGEKRGLFPFAPLKGKPPQVNGGRRQDPVDRKRRREG